MDDERRGRLIILKGWSTEEVEDHFLDFGSGQFIKGISTSKE